MNVLDEASDPWGVKVKRYELKSITPPRDVLEAMEKQMRAEREKRAQILESEGDRDSRINRSEGQKQEAIRQSEAEKTRRINEADGQAHAVLAVAQATAEGINKIAEAISAPGGQDAANLRIAEDYVKEFGKLAQTSNSMIIPASANDLGGMVATAMGVLDKVKTAPKA